jgi:ribosomal protein S6--L-glutamate ligase
MNKREDVKNLKAINKMSEGKRKKKVKTTIGWEEWCAFPGLGLPAIKAKVDTGAKTSALHAYDIKRVTKDGQNYASFKIHPLQTNESLTLECMAPLVDMRFITSSNGEREKRCVIKALIVIGEKSYETEVTLTSRHKMRFRFLLGREALRKGRFLVDPAKSYVLGKVLAPQKLYSGSSD